MSQIRAQRSKVKHANLVLYNLYQKALAENTELKTRFGITPKPQKSIRTPQDTHTQETQVEIPHISIQMESIFDLPYPNGGWVVNINKDLIKSLKLDQKEIVIAGVLGPYDAGKTFFCNELAKRNLSSGYTKRTPGIEISYPVQEGDFFGVVDTPGSQEAIRTTDPSLLEKINANRSKLRSNEKNLCSCKLNNNGDCKLNKDGDCNPNNAQSQHYQDYADLRTDAKLLENLKEKFITEIAGIAILICNKLSDSEQSMIHKMKQNVKDYNAKLNRENNGDKTVHQKQLFIVHNYKMLTKVEDVKAQITRDLDRCFIIKKKPLFNVHQNTSRPLEDCDYYYEDQFDIPHLILAAKETEAGDYYNSETMNFLFEQIRNSHCRAAVNFAEKFREFCNRHLSQLLSQSIEVEIKEGTDGEGLSKSFIRTEKHAIDMSRLSCDLLGNFIPSSGYAPRYSKSYQRLNDEEEEVTIDVEILNSEIQAEIDETGGGTILRVFGEKKVRRESDADQQRGGVEFINYTREEGKFDLSIEVSKDKKKTKIEKSFPGDVGIVRYVITVKKPSAMRL